MQVGERAPSRVAEPPSWSTHAHNLSHEGNVNKAKRWMHTMYSEGVAPTPRVFANLLTVYMRSMTKVLSVYITILCPVRYLTHPAPPSQISGKPRDLTMLEKMDGRSLLQPWEPPKDRGRIGDGGIAVDADDEDVSSDASATATTRTQPLTRFVGADRCQQAVDGLLQLGPQAQLRGRCDR